MRELTFATWFPDVALLPDLHLGMPTLGWAAHAPGQLVRDNPPDAELESLEIRRDNFRDTHNRLLFETLKGSGDEELDEASWNKTKEEFKTGLGRALHAT